MTTAGLPKRPEFPALLKATPGVFEDVMNRLEAIGEEEGRDKLEALSNFVLAVWCSLPMRSQLPAVAKAYVDDAEEATALRLTFKKAEDLRELRDGFNVDAFLKRLIATEHPEDGGELIWD